MIFRLASGPDGTDGTNTNAAGVSHARAREVMPNEADARRAGGDARRDG